NGASSIWIVEPEASEPFKKLADLPITVNRPQGITWTADGSAVYSANKKRTATSFCSMSVNRVFECTERISLGSLLRPVDLKDAPDSIALQDTSILKALRMFVAYPATNAAWSSFRDRGLPGAEAGTPRQGPFAGLWIDVGCRNCGFRRS